MIHLVQIGVIGWIGRFRAEDRRERKRGCQVVCRTERGLEIGTVLTAINGTSTANITTGESDAATNENCDGQLLRRMTPDDRLILQRIERFRDRAWSACSDLIRQRGLPAVLVDVEHLFDGQSLYFYFLGEVTGELSALTGELAETWEAKVRFRKFTERLAEGCGPDCGTGESGCGSGGCGTCSLKTACKTASSTASSTSR